jgi:hypothetical protein
MATSPSAGCGCKSYRPGHNAHVIQATRANSDPTSWFAAKVTDLDAEEAIVEYDDGSSCRLWRHGGFDARVTVGTALLVAETWSLVSIDGTERGGQLSVEVRNHTWRKDRLPEDRDRTWRAGVVDLSTGEGVDIVHGEEKDQD